MVLDLDTSVKADQKVLKRSAGEGRRRSVGPIACKMKNYYNESKKKKGVSYIQ